VRVATADVIRQVLTENALEFTESEPGVFTVELPGERKLKTGVTLAIRDQALGIHAFVARHPDENHEGVYRWLLERNLKMYGVAFAVDHVGDIYLNGKVALQSVTPSEVDRLLGAVLEYADSSFNTILELGFASSIRKEYEWRLARGESTRNLEAFKGWLESGEAPAPR
jgi:Putative bacterial sensory transduction regulator